MRTNCGYHNKSIILVKPRCGSHSNVKNLPRTKFWSHVHGNIRKNYKIPNGAQPVLT